MTGKTLNTANIREALLRTAKYAKSLEDVSDLVQEVGKMQLEFVRGRFLEQIDSNNKPWEESAASKKRRKRGGKPSTLFDSGSLFRSIYVRTSKNQVTITSNSPYAMLHHHGGKVRLGNKTVTLPARPFLNVGAGDSRLITNFLRKTLRERIK